MSDHAWALQTMMKYRLQVDFSRKTIHCRGYNNVWGWNLGDNSDFYKALQTAIIDIERTV